MATPVIMPRQGQSVESCIITSWAKNVGDEVKVGDVLFSYETDKSSFDEAAQVAGTLLAILRPEGDEVPCLENVCVIGAPGEDISAFAAGAAPAEAPAPAAAAEEKKEAAAPKAEAAVTVKTEAGDRLFASPRAKALAEKAGVPVEAAAPTGPEGRIIERDVQALLDKGYEKAPAKAEEAPAKAVAAAAPAAEAQTAPAYEDVKLSNIRKVIARSMHDSLANGAQLTLNASFDASAIMAYRASLKAAGEGMGLTNITLNDIVVYAAAKTLEGFGALNAHYLDDKIRLFKDVHMGIAVDTERGLMVPTVANANTNPAGESAPITPKHTITTWATQNAPDCRKRRKSQKEKDVNTSAKVVGLNVCAARQTGSAHTKNVAASANTSRTRRRPQSTRRIWPRTIVGNASAKIR